MSRTSFFKDHREYCLLGIVLAIISFVLLAAFMVIENMPSKSTSTTSTENFPYEHIFQAQGKNFSYEKVTWDGYEGMLIKGDNQERILCNLANGNLVIGELLSPDGRNITRLMAEYFHAETFLSALAASSLHSDEKKAAKPQALQAKPAPMGDPVSQAERVISQNLFDFLEKMPGFELAAKDGPLRLVIFSWEDCPSCRSVKNAIAKMELPFRVKEIPTGGNPAQDKKAIARLQEKNIAPQEARWRLMDASRILMALTGELVVPCYAWKMPDGQILFGVIPAQEVLGRLKDMALPK